MHSHTESVTLVLLDRLSLRLLLGSLELDSHFLLSRTHLSPDMQHRRVNGSTNNHGALPFPIAVIMPMVYYAGASVFFFSHGCFGWSSVCFLGSRSEKFSTIYHINLS